MAGNDLILLDRKEIEDWIVVLDDDSNITEKASRYLPRKVVSTLFDTLFLDGNYSARIIEQLESEDKVLVALSGGAIYSTRIIKPFFNLDTTPYKSIIASVHGAMVNTSDRHLLDCIIAVGMMLPNEIIGHETLQMAIEYYVKYQNKHNPGSIIYEHEYSGMSTKMHYRQKVFSDQYVYFVVDVRDLCDLYPLKYGVSSKISIKTRLDKLGLTEFRLTFLDKNDKNLMPGSTPKFKLLEPSYYTFVNMNGLSRQRKQLNENSYTHLIVGVGAGYIKSLQMHSTIKRKIFIEKYAGLTNKRNVLDFIKTISSHKPTFILNKSIKDFLRAYYEEKAVTGNVSISTKINSTFKELMSDGQRTLIEECLHCRIEPQYSDKPSKNGVKLIDGIFRPKLDVLETK